MKTTFSSPSMAGRKACWLGFATFALLAALAPHAEAQSSLTAYYDPATGNIKLQNTTSSVLEVTNINLLTLGNGTQGPATPNNEGYLNGTTASFAAFTNPPFFSALNEATTGSQGNGPFSQISAATLGGTVMFSLQGYPEWSPSSPIGPSNSYWDFGNVAALGMSQSDIDSRFIADGFGTLGRSVYQVRVGAGVGPTIEGNINVVPEPSPMALAGVGAAALGFWGMRRRSR